MQRQNKLRLQLLLGTALLAAPVSAFAGSDPVAVDPTPTGLADIVVTATKRETNLQDTPISISVMGSEALEKIGRAHV